MSDLRLTGDGMDADRDFGRGFVLPQ